MSYTNRNFGSAPTLPNPDTLQEFSARSSNFDASNGGAGASIKLTTHSGTNDMHGTLFEFLRNDKMDARNFFDVNVEPYKQNQYGGTLGGPIKKDKLGSIFVAAFQGTNPARRSQSGENMTVPDALERTGNYSQSGKTIVDPDHRQKPFPTRLSRQAASSPIALGLDEVCSAAQRRGGNTLYTSSIGQPGRLPSSGQG